MEEAFKNRARDALAPYAEATYARCARPSTQRNAFSTGSVTRAQNRKEWSERSGYRKLYLLFVLFPYMFLKLCFAVEFFAAAFVG